MRKGSPGTQACIVPLLRVPSVSTADHMSPWLGHLLRGHILRKTMKWRLFGPK